MVTSAIAQTNFPFKMPFIESTGPVETHARPISGLLRVNAETRIPGTPWKLAFDMGVKLEYGDNHVFAISPWIDEYGQGSTQEEAITDLLASLADFRESIERQSGSMNLADELSETLSNLRILLITG